MILKVEEYQLEVEYWLVCQLLEEDLTDYQASFVKNQEQNLRMQVQELLQPTEQLVRITIQIEEIRVSLFSLFFYSVQ